MQNIKSWVLEDQPRYKLSIHGTSHLTTTELISIIINTGNKNHSALELSRHLLTRYESLQELSRKSIIDLKKIKGIGESKAASLVAAFELGRRKGIITTSSSKIDTSRIAYEILKPQLEDLNYEEFKILLLNRSNSLIKVESISKGGIAGTVVDAKLIFKSALDNLASGIILSHNHPSGNLQPSSQDISITNKLVEAGKLIDVQIIDHLIISNKGYFSFKDEGLF